MKPFNPLTLVRMMQIAEGGTVCTAKQSPSNPEAESSTAVPSALQYDRITIIRADRRARMLYEKAENLLETNIAKSILLYEKAIETLKAHNKEYLRWAKFQKMIRAINTRIGDAYCRAASEAEAQKKQGFVAHYRNALGYYQKGLKYGDTAELIDYCKMRLGYVTVEKDSASPASARARAVKEKA